MSELRVKEHEGASASKWNRLVDRLPSPRQGNAAGSPILNPSRQWCLNNSSEDRDAGECLAVSHTWNGPADFYECLTKEIPLSGDAVDWHSNISRVAICCQPIAAGEYGWVVTSGLAIAKIDIASGGFLIPSPCDPHLLMETTGGIARIVARTATFGLVELGQVQPLFRYRRTNDWGPASLACLNSIDDVTLGAITLLDPEGITDDQGPDDRGLCQLVGNTWVVVNANCALAGDSEFVVPCDCPAESSSSSSGGE